MTALDPGHPSADLSDYLLGLADDALVSAQRMGEWIASSPQIEEDVALGNIALDLLGQARSLLGYAGSLEDPARSEDDLAYLRDPEDFRNVHLVERPWGTSPDSPDFGVAMARLLVLSAYHCELYAALRSSTDETVAAVAAKAVKEVDYHRDHATVWVLRLGDGTDESHRRVQAALEAEWPFVDELFDDSHLSAELVDSGVAVRPSALRAAFDDRVAGVVAEATLVLPEVLDPEVPVLTIEDLGILRSVESGEDGVVVTITPTYSGCPAMDAIRDDIVSAFAAEGRQDVRVDFVLAPAWTTDWMSEAGRRKLAAYGIAPPRPRAGADAGQPGEPGQPVPLTLSLRCPQCGSPDTRELSRFGSTACKSLWVCSACREPFDHFKSI